MIKTYLKHEPMMFLQLYYVNSKCVKNSVHEKKEKFKSKVKPDPQRIFRTT